MNQPVKLPKIHINAEFQRLWWTNVNIGLLVAVMVLYFLFWFGMSSDEYGSVFWVLENIGLSGMMLSAVAAYVMIERSIHQDINSNAFDQLRMSALSPWQMAYSRILVAPAVAWVGFWTGWLFWAAGSALSRYGMDQGELIFLVSLPFFAWALGCVILINALQFRRHDAQWTGSAVQLVGTAVIAAWITASLFASFEQRDRLYSILEDSDLPFSIFLCSFAVMAAVFGSIAVHAAMANRLHLKNGQAVFLGLGLASPLLFWWLSGTVKSALMVTVLCYTMASVLSVLTQNCRESVLTNGFASLKNKQFRLPAWVVLLPIALILAMFLSLETFWAVAGVVLLLVIVCLGNSLRFAFNSLTLAMVLYLCIRILFYLIR